MEGLGVSSTLSNANCIKSEVDCKHLYKLSAVDPDKYDHALDIDYTSVPLCTVKPSVIKGYVLPNMPWRYYLKTLWTPNNETLNVWTHLIPALYYLLMLSRYNQTMDIVHNWPILVSIIGATMVALCSSLAHLFRNRSTIDHCYWMMLDFYGIIAYSFASTVSHFFACSEPTHYARLGAWNIYVFTLNCCIVFPLLCITNVPNFALVKQFGDVMRIGGLAYGYIYGIVPIFDRLMTSGLENAAMSYHVLSCICMMTASYMYITDKPQSFSPGTFDIVGHNHQIFHIFSGLSMYFDILAVYLDIASSNGPWIKLQQQVDHPSLSMVSFCALFVTLWCLMVGGCIARLVRNELDKNGVLCCMKCSCHPSVKATEKKSD